MREGRPILAVSRTRPPPEAQGLAAFLGAELLAVGSAGYKAMAVLTGEATGRPGAHSVTLFDSTGLAIQDLAVAAAALEAWRSGRVAAPLVTL